MAPPAPITRLPGTTLVRHLPFYRQACVLAEEQALHRHPIWRSPAVDLAGLPVVVVGGLVTNPQVLHPA